MKWFALIFLLLEVFVTIEVAKVIGGWYLFLEIIATAFIGIFILMNFRQTLTISMMQMMQQKMNLKELITNNLLTLLGAILLIIPGIITDTLGAFLQLGLLQLLIAKRVGVKKASEDYQEHTYTPKNKGDDDVIDVEIIEHTTLK